MTTPAMIVQTIESTRPTGRARRRHRVRSLRGRLPQRVGEHDQRTGGRWRPDHLLHPNLPVVDGPKISSPEGGCRRLEGVDHVREERGERAQLPGLQQRPAVGDGRDRAIS
jgi:hypothetical protein